MDKVGNMSEQDAVRREQVMLEVQTGQYSPQDKRINPIDSNKGRMSLVVILVYSLISLNIKCIENQAECGLVWTFDEAGFGISRQSLPNRISETREFYICTNMYPFNKMRDKLGIIYI